MMKTSLGARVVVVAAALALLSTCYRAHAQTTAALHPTFAPPPPLVNVRKPPPAAWNPPPSGFALNPKKPPFWQPWVRPNPPAAP